jgi:hypothetical protein
MMAGATGLEPATFGVTGQPVPQRNQRLFPDGGRGGYFAKVGRVESRHGGRSSSVRTADSGPVSLGSNPSPLATQLTGFSLNFF